MEREQGAQTRGSIPRLSSRLPTPRASNDTFRTIKSAPSREDIHTEGSIRISDLQRPSVNSQYRSTVPSTTPLGENVNRSIRSRFGWPQGTSQTRIKQSPVREVLSPSQDSVLETTPPSSIVQPQPYGNGDEVANSTRGTVADENSTSGPVGLSEKRKPRPSLSERTMETLSQISPSPSPARRRSSVFAHDSTMGPPSRPASSMRNSRPSTSHGSRPSSPTKRQFRPPGASSPTKEVPPVPLLPLPGSIYTPPKAFMRDKTSRITKPLRETRRSISSTVTDSHHQASHSKIAVKSLSQTVKVKSASGSASVTDKPKGSKPSLSTLFKDAPATVLSSTQLDTSDLEKKPGLLRPRSFGENTLAPSMSSSPVSRDSGRAPFKEPDAASNATKTAKSSAALRETIARAKAEAAKKKTYQAYDVPIIAGLDTALQSVDPQSPSPTILSSGLLRKRIEGAVTTGYLNIAAMRLKQIPNEVMMMYDLDSTTNTNWAETVDLAKLIAADNELTELRDETFPDWSAEEMMEDDTKTNQFGGLETLDFHSNMLQSIPLGLRRLERLHTLNLSNNLLSSNILTTICQMTNLRELYLADNQLSGILTSNIAQLENLQVLDLHGNELESLPVSMRQLGRLRVLKLSKNKLTRIPFETLTALPLVEISAANNKLSGTLFTESVREMITLRSLDLSFNSLESLTNFEEFSLPNLLSLAVDGNRLCRFPNVSTWKSLATFTASENLLTDFPAGFAMLSVLKNSDFSRNNIKTIPEGIALMENLSSLNLSSNPLRDRKYLNMSTDDLKEHLQKRLAPIENAEDVGTRDDSSGTKPELLSDSDTKDNSQSPKYIHNPSNGVLDLSSQDLTRFNISTVALTETVKITTLKISSTHLVHLPLNLLHHPSINPYLQHLDLSHNPLSATEYLTSPVHLPKLLTLNIVSTGLTSLDALTTHLKAPQLRELNISCHRLTGHVPWLRALAFPNLRVLLATDNWFSSLDVEAVRGLETLDVKNNGIEALPAKIGMLGNHQGKVQEGRLRVFEVGGNRFRVPRHQVIERGTESVLRDLRRMIPIGELDAEWKDDA